MPRITPLILALLAGPAGCSRPAVPLTAAPVAEVVAADLAPAAAPAPEPPPPVFPFPDDQAMTSRAPVKGRSHSARRPASIPTRSGSPPTSRPVCSRRPRRS